MFVWCAYCQRLVGERPPLSNPSITHGLCEACHDIGEADPDGEIPIHRDRLAFFNELFRAARVGDLTSCAAFVRRGLEMGIAPGDLAFGTLQPVLEEVGQRWQEGMITIADEHRVTRWCDVLLAQLPHTADPEPPLDLLGVLVPGNHHGLGGSLAELVLREHGFRASFIPYPLPSNEVVRLSAALEPRAIAISCSLVEHVETASAIALALRDAGYSGKILVVGQAVRRNPTAWRELPLEGCATLWEVRDALQDEGRSHPEGQPSR